MPPDFVDRRRAVARYNAAMAVGFVELLLLSVAVVLLLPGPLTPLLALGIVVLGFGFAM